MRSAPQGASIASAPAPSANPPQNGAPGFSAARRCPTLRACLIANHAPKIANASRHNPHQNVAVRTAAAASSRPAPYLSEAISGARLEDDWSSRSTAPGELTPKDITSAAAPATCGVAMLVPWNQRQAGLP